MSSLLKPNEDLQLRMAELLQQIVICVGPLQTMDPQGRQRVTVDAITGSLTLGAITTVTTVSTVTNTAAIAGEGVRMYEVPAYNNFSNSILSNLVFG